MNSLQRRKSKREHPYGISINISRNELFFVLEDRVNVATAWCKKKSTSSYVFRYSGRYSCVFKFASEKDAVIFGLKFI